MDSEMWCGHAPESIVGFYSVVKKNEICRKIDGTGKY